jgi:hypothetical protein
MRDVKAALDRIQPTPEARGDWDAVLQDARVRRPSALVRPLAGVAAAVAALFALALFQPWQGESPTFLERALAAVDDGPVLHVVLRGEWGGTLLDLDTGKREPVHGEHEYWYDTERGRVHSIMRLGEAINHEVVYEPKKPLPELVALGRDYRQALESGTARVTGDAVVDGERVAWITIRSEMLPDSSDGKLHEWAQQVAVSRETFRPVATRETRDGEPGPGTGNRVLELETLPPGDGDFTASKAESLEGMAFREGRETIALREAADAVGENPLWLGREHAGLPLAQVSRLTTSVARREQIKLTGAVARRAERCFELRDVRSRARKCLRALGVSPLVSRPDGVYTYGRVAWQGKYTAAVFFYGTLGDDPSTYREDVIPLYDRPHVQIRETTRPSPHARVVGNYVPPEGSVFVSTGGRMGSVRVDGVYVSIEASSEELVLSAVRALEPMPG